MKPINLKLQGLHSYQELQEVDFTKLCERGTFGIFGPTGSGKSTVLDAITLALFGKVERAARSTQGILNHNSDKLYVSFTFELNTANTSTRYLVERQLKRTGENTVQSANCRLIEESESGQKVLADKVKDVNEAVVSILGLTVDDFTRAVVLPQGKFAEFLSLQGVDRRMMLQRLFSLENYGDKLQDKLRKRDEQVSNNLQGILREQQGLGDASETAIATIRGELQKAEELELKTKKSLEATQKEFEKSKQLWTWQEELDEIVTNKNLLLADEHKIIAFKEELKLAEKAEAIRHLLEDHEQTSILKIKQEKELLAIQEVFTKAKKQQQLLQEKYLKVEKHWEDIQPALIAKKTKLEEAKTIEQELESLLKEGKEAADKKKVITAELTQIEDQLDLLKKRKSKDIQSLSLIKNEIKKHSLAPEYKEQVNLAYQTYREYQNLIKLLEDSRLDYERKKSEFQNGQNIHEQGEKVLHEASIKEQESSQSFTDHLKKCPGDTLGFQKQKQSMLLSQHHINDVVRNIEEIKEITAKLTSLNRELAGTKETFEQQNQKKSKLKRQLQKLELEQINLEKLLEDIEKQNIAARLVTSLEEGHPCPVCGSKDHPSPIQIDDIGETSIYRGKLKEVKKQIDHINEDMLNTEKDIYQQNILIQNYSEQIERQESLLKSKNQDQLKLRSNLPEAWQKLNGDELLLTYQREMEMLKDLEKDLDLWEKQRVVLEKTLQEASQKYNEAKSQKEILHNRLQSLEQRVNEEKTKYATLHAKVKEKEVDLNQIRGSLKISQIKNEWQKINDWDKKNHTLVDTSEKIELELNRINAFLEEAENNFKTKQILQAEQNANLNQLKTAYDEKEKLLKAITKGETTEKLLDDTNQELMALREEKNKTKITLETIIQENLGLEKKLTTLAADFANTINREKTINQKLEEGVPALGFLNEQEARTSLRTSETRKDLQETIGNFTKKLAMLLQREEEYQKLIDNQSISEKQWKVVQDSLQKANENYRASLEEKGAAQRAFEDISKKHDRWQQLEEEAKDLKKQGTILKELRRVLIGNALVEFMAEEHLFNIARIASTRLGELTKNRYTLEVDAEGGFIIRDDANGGYRRPVSSLSGGETFLVSFSLALALSSQIQLKGQYPLEFFFLDEGFGSLDQELLEIVMNALERLQMESLSIGVISHVQEMRNRMARRLIVTPAQAGEVGSKLSLEIG